VAHEASDSVAGGATRLREDPENRLAYSNIALEERSFRQEPGRRPPHVPDSGAGDATCDATTPRRIANQTARRGSGFTVADLALARACSDNPSAEM
jgi:hypothetical protein